MKIDTSPSPRPLIAIDGVFFQIGNLGIARVWRSLLSEWTKSGFSTHLLVIDRGDTAPKYPEINYHPTSKFDFASPAQESFKIQEICDRYQVDLFISTGYSTPIATPSVCLVHDLLQEVMGLELTTPFLQEKFYAIHHAIKHFAVSSNTAKDLLHFFPHLSPQSLKITFNGVDHSFVPVDQSIINIFLKKHNINKPYFLVAGERYGYLNIGERHHYKNIEHFFRAWTKFPQREQFAIVCVGGQPVLEPELTQLAGSTDVYLLFLSDAELIAAYSGATALVYPSRYEGFGLPVLEAMACGCPVITCRNSSLPEVAGDAAIYVSETDLSDLVAALEEIQQPEIRQELISRGLQRSQQFSWTKMADTIATELMTIYEEFQQGKIAAINPLWLPLRRAETNFIAELQQLYWDLNLSEIQIASIKTSKFWRLRQMWFKLKKAIDFS